MSGEDNRLQVAALKMFQERHIRFENTLDVCDALSVRRGNRNTDPAVGVLKQGFDMASQVHFQEPALTIRKSGDEKARPVGRPGRRLKCGLRRGGVNCLQLFAFQI